MPARYAIPLIFVLVLLPRIALPGMFLTFDEAYHWFDRSKTFLRSMQTGDYAATNLIGHPGVTTMWLGAAGQLAHDNLVEAGWIDHTDRHLYFAMLRLPLAVANALCVALAYPLLRRLLGGTAWLAVLFWATAPFLIAHSKLVHVDALLTALMTLTLLTAMLAFRLDAAAQDLTAAPRPPISWPWLLASAAAGGLAFLTKSPALLLLPMGALIALVGLIRTVGRARGRWWQIARVWLLACVVWAGVAAVVWALLWPAVWVTPLEALNRVYMQVRYEGTTPHGWGNFFLGTAVDDPGPLFYPLAIAFRLTPWVLVGLVLGVVALGWRTGEPRHRLIIALLLVFVLLFVGVLGLSPKKFDRYALPLFPALCIIAAYGWARAWEKLRPALGRYLPALQQPVVSALLTAGGVALLAANIAWYHPYELAYYSPLLGGGTVAATLLPVGWGEGLGEAGRYITRQSNGCDYPVATYYQPVLKPFLCSPEVPLTDTFIPGRVDYVVLYIDQIQRRNDWEVTERMQTSPPVHTVHIHGIDYATVYQIPRPLAQRVEADFGPAMRLHSYQIDTSALRATSTLTLTLQWQARAHIATDHMLFVHVLDAQGQRIGQIDVPPGGPSAPPSAWNVGHYYTWRHPVPLMQECATDVCWIAVGVYDPQENIRLPLERTPPPDAPDDGPHVLFLRPLRTP